MIETGAFNKNVFTYKAETLFLKISVLIHILAIFVFMRHENNHIQKTFSLHKSEIGLLKNSVMAIKKEKENIEKIFLNSKSDNKRTIKKNKNKTKVSTEKESGINDVTSSKNSSGENSILSKYLYEVRQTIVKNRYKNNVASKLRLKGEVEVGFVISKDNEIKALKILKSSGYEPLDQSAMQTIKKISSFPNIPNEIANKDLSINFVIEFL